MQDTPKLSVLVSFRDREPARVERFLAGLARQTFRDFELIFVDYGSRDDLAARVREIVVSHPFARHFYNDTRGMAWNKAHALNSGARLSRGPYLLCTDIDLIYSPTVLDRLAAAARPEAAAYGGFYLLPRRFRDWPRLSGGEIPRLPPSDPTAVGPIQLVPREAFFRLRGLDEFFRLWGVEDCDFQERLERAGYPYRWLGLLPVYHQWHPGLELPRMPSGWLELMNFHSVARRGQPARNGETWGKCLGPADRPSRSAERMAAGAKRYVLPSRQESARGKLLPAIPRLAAWSRIEFVRELAADLAGAKSGAVFVCEINDSASIRLWELLLRSVLRFRCRIFAGRRFFDYRKEAGDIIWHIIMLSGLVADYSIEEGRGVTRYVLVRA